MDHHDVNLKMYAKNGFRSMEDWASLSREVLEGHAPRTDVIHRGKPLPLYTRDQTRARLKAIRHRDAADAAASSSAKLPAVKQEVPQ